MTAVRAAPMQLAAGGLRIALNANGSLRRLDHGDIVVNLFVGNDSRRRPGESRAAPPRGATIECTGCSGRAARRAGNADAGPDGRRRRRLARAALDAGAVAGG